MAVEVKGRGKSPSVIIFQLFVQRVGRWAQPVGADSRHGQTDGDADFGIVFGQAVEGVEGVDLGIGFLAAVPLEFLAFADVCFVSCAGRETA